MCTVSFYKNNKEVIITSNRDEKISRPLALVPSAEHYMGVPLFYPKDPQAGGSWFVVNKHADTFVLLNGAETKHNPTPPYEKSRGLILLELAASTNFLDAWNNIPLNRIEPFTIVAYVKQNLYQLRWNASAKECISLNTLNPSIWSSSTLYEPIVQKQREQWFMEFNASKQGVIYADDAIHFHTQTHTHDAVNGLLINRGGTMSKSVTQVVIQTDAFVFTHIDLIQNTRTSITEKIA